MENLNLQIIASFLTILFTGISVYAAIKVALAEVRKDIEYLTRAIQELQGDHKEIRSDIRDILHNRRT